MTKERVRRKEFERKTNNEGIQVSHSFILALGYEVFRGGYLSLILAIGYGVFRGGSYLGYDLKQLDSGFFFLGLNSTCYSILVYDFVIAMLIVHCQCYVNGLGTMIFEIYIHMYGRDLEPFLVDEECYSVILLYKDAKMFATDQGVNKMHVIIEVLPAVELLAKQTHSELDHETCLIPSEDELISNPIHGDSDSELDNEGDSETELNTSQPQTYEPEIEPKNETASEGY
ncbi:hypothetical protein FNV43_RR00705 [Rhamnella rubrinervis]|uniref:Uncharacterized protein n=1 Tax=Rhamnella rubrinervis TaxID=2594499 RepID=A0A8K0HNC0_9ROSA|nr:hypothetical protein FNV43_RR00705 [Rhamnella rubrinervis]